jgi:hypothetical protein
MLHSEWRQHTDGCKARGGAAHGMMTAAAMPGVQLLATTAPPAPAPALATAQQSAVVHHSVDRATSKPTVDGKVPPKYTARGGQDTQKTCSNCHKLIINHYSNGTKVPSGNNCPYPPCQANPASRCSKKSCNGYHVE